jgi:hypothetical protein
LKRDSNLRYFHGIANGRHQKKRIHSLVQDEGLIEGHEPFKSYITNYYKGPFGAPKESFFSLKETRTDNIPHMSMEENGLLTAPYYEDEVMKAIFLMESYITKKITPTNLFFSTCSYATSAVPPNWSTSFS